MNKLKLMINSIYSTAFLTFVILIVMSFILVIFPLSYYQSLARIAEDDLEGYIDELADYCMVSFGADNYYKDLAQKFDMENYAGIVEYDYMHVQIPDEDYPRSIGLSFISEKAVNSFPSCGYNFSKTKPNGYREAYAPRRMDDIWKVGKTYDICVFEGAYEYKQKIKILGYSDNDYYEFNSIYTYSFVTYSPDLLIYDDIPPYANVPTGMMISDHKAEYYKNLGATRVDSMRDINMRSRMSEVNDFFLYWCVCGIGLFIVVVAANYYFAADKLIKRSGVMYIFGGKRANVILIELVKMLLLFVLSFAISLIPITIAITSEAVSDILDWTTYFICLGIIFVIYLLSILPGFVKLARFNPLKAIANNNVE